MAAMAARVNAIRTHWSRPEIHVEVFQLEQEQYDRANWLAGKLDRLSYWTPDPRWDDVLAGMALIEERLSSGGS